MYESYRARNGAISMRRHLFLGGMLLAAMGTHGMAAADSQAANPRTVAVSHPPLAESITVVPLARPTADGSTARIEIAYKKGQKIPDTFPVQVKDKPYKANRIKGDLFALEAPFDFGAFVAEQERRKRLSPTLGKVAVFSGREVTDHRPLAFMDPGKLERQIAKRLPIRIEADVLRGFSENVQSGSSLLVNAVPVVEDSQRTYDACTGTGNPNGAWTFKRLMENIANEAVTGINAADLVEDWLLSLGVEQTINQFLIPSREQRVADLLTLWPRDGANRLNLQHAPFRLLAIVNRVDLRKNSAYSPGSAGEGRFVFGIMKPLAEGGCNQEFGTVILEYGVPLQHCPAIQDYGLQWANLDQFALGAPAYNAALQVITDQFTSANAAPSKPNGSALNQLRINDFPIFAPWELREFHLSETTHLLETTSTALTPHFETFNGFAGPVLADFIDQNENQILLERHDIPEMFSGMPFLTGSAMNPHQTFLLPKVWNPPGVSNPDARHLFALNTCNGCHGRETKAHEFVHVSNRNMGHTSALSQFLVGEGDALSPTTFTMNDPVHATLSRTFGDLVRRGADLETLVNLGCSSGGLLDSLQGVSPAQVH